MPDLTPARQALAAGQRDEARTLLMHAARSNPGDGETWYLLAQTIDEPAHKLDCLNRAAAAGYKEPPEPATIKLSAPEPPPAAPTRPCPRCGEPNPVGANFCSRCALAFNAPPPVYYPPPQPQMVYMQAPPQKRNRLLPALLGVIVAVCVAFWLIGEVGRKAGTFSSSGSPLSSSGSNTARSVTYKIGGTTSRASLTYENATGNTQQEDITVPWTKKISVPRGTFLYLSAQNDNASGTITCEIVVDGVKIEEASSSGAYVIAGCSGLAP